MPHTPIRDPIVSRNAVGVTPDGREFVLTAQIGRPYPTGDDWACPVDLEPLYPRLLDQHGVDSWQALQLCYRLIAQLLVGFQENGGSCTGQTGANQWRRPISSRVVELLRIPRGLAAGRQLAFLGRCPA